MTFKFYTYEEILNIKTSSFLELQYCKSKKGSSIIKIVSVNRIEHKKIDSLYVLFTDITSFQKYYEQVFNCGIYNNLKSGYLDIFGINYYKKALISNLITEIEKNKLPDYETICEWLEKSLEYNGVYILGI